MTATREAYVARRHWSPRGTWDADRVVEALRDWTRLTGSPPRSYEWSPATAAVLGLDSPRVRLWRQHYPRWPSAATVSAYFGRWSKALHAAGLAPHREVAPGEQRAARIEAAREMARTGLGTGAIAGVLGVSPRTVRDYLRAGSCADCGTPVVTAERCPRCAARESSRPRFTRQEVLDAIRAWAAATGEPPRLEEWAPSSDPESRWAREFPRWPSYMTARTHFGSWAAALEAAGYAPHRRSWDRESIVEALRALDRPPLHSELGGAALPALGTVRHHFGSLGAALQAAGLDPHRRRWGPEDVLDAIARFHALTGRLPAARDWRGSSADHPHATTVRLRFGSWSEAIEAYERRAAQPPQVG